MIGMKVSVYTGIPLLFVSLVLGMQWAHVALREWSFFDVKIIGSFFLLAIYGSVLFLTRSGKLTGNDLAWANGVAFLCVIINFFLGSRLSEFHFWV